MQNYNEYQFVGAIDIKNNSFGKNFARMEMNSGIPSRLATTLGLLQDRTRLEKQWTPSTLLPDNINYLHEKKQRKMESAVWLSTEYNPFLFDSTL